MKKMKYMPILLAISELFVLTAHAQTAPQEIVIDSNRVSDQEKSTLIQKEAPNYVNVINAEEIKQIPSFNPADVVRTLPGVSEAHDTGEARYVYIRGLDADYNSTTLDGVKLLPAAQGSPANGSGGRAVAFDSIPTGLIDSITVTKTLRPDQDAEAIGGTIEMTTKEMPLDGKNMFFDGKIGGGYEPLHSTPLFEGSATFGFRFGAGNSDKTDSKLTSYSDKPFSLVLFGSLARDRRGIEDLEPGVPSINGVLPAYAGTWDQRYYDYTRTRHGLGLNLTYQPDANNSYYFKAFDTGYIERKSDNIVTVNPNSGANPVSNGNGTYTDPFVNPAFSKNLVDHQEQIKNNLFSIGGKNIFDNKTLDYYAAYSMGRYSVDYDYNSVFNYTGAYSNSGLIYSTNGKGGTPLYSFAANGINPVDYANPANWTLDHSNLYTERSTDQQLSTGINLKSKVTIGGFEDENVKFGLNARFRGKDIQYGEFSDNGANANTLTLNGLTNGQINSFYNGQYNNGPAIQTGLIQNLLTYVPNVLGSKYYAPLLYQHDTENVYAGYGQYEFKHGRWSVLGGVRYEYTDTAVTSNHLDASGINLASATNENTYGNIFPSIQGKYELEKDTFLRFAYSTGVARPTFNQLNPAFNGSTTGSITSFSVGNPNLKATTANSFDLSLEKYLNSGGVVSVGVFEKLLANVIAPRTTYYANGYNQNGISLPGITQANTFSNIDGNSTVNGLEFNYVQKFDKIIDGALGGLGTAVNFTLVNSRVEQNPGEFSTLPGTSKNIANASIFYDKYGFFARVGLNYASASLYSTGSNVANNTYYDSRTFLDASLGYRVNKNYQVYFSASNLLDQPMTYYVGEPSQLLQREFYGPTFKAGVNFNF
jgi:TonB-dependent receptor